ncbi:MAG: YkgJ family cysteine cluster protein [Candidatus Zixiibacteriota bacterium]|nr:MAG: YkgJ family cysteine cluster protein [candidate division Zixibacteria bacterium]
MCCKNFSSNDRIIIEPYDVLRLSRRLSISTGKFLEQYADLTLDDHTHFPVALLKYKGNRRRNKCHFLRSYGCSVYEDRPLRCRLYPLGRILNRGKSYFIHIGNCICEDSPGDKSWGAQEWTDASGAEDYLDYQGCISDIFSFADWDAYRNLNKDLKHMLGEALCNIDGFLEKIPEISRPVSDKEIMLSLKCWIEGFFIDNGCLESDYRTKKVVKFTAGTGAEKSEFTGLITVEKKETPLGVIK